MDDLFLGTGWSFPPTFDKNEGGVIMKSAEDNIRKSLRVLMLTRFGEKVMDPTFGSDINNIIFNTMDTTRLTLLKNRIEEAILYHEPRVHLDDVKVEPNATEGILNILLSYTIPTTNSRQNMVFPYYITEGTNIQP